MPTIYRIVHRNYADDPYSGEGGLHAASRWSWRGRRVSYAADTLALATLETLARAGSLERLSEMMYAPADLDEAAVKTLSRETLPPGWDRRPPGDASREVGDQWLKAASSVALRVPSVMIPKGTNFVLNPAHANFSDALSPSEARPLALDPRLAERLSR